MNSLARVFSNFKDFYSEINGATLTGAIDVIVVEQPDGEYLCSPFHVRFGKLGVLRSREKVVDIEINGAPVDIQMKLGDSGEAFFVEECHEDDGNELPENLATSPIPKSFLANVKDTDVVGAKSASEDLQLALPLPRRNSIDFSKETAKEADIDGGTKFENQVSDYTKRRHTDNTLERRNLSEKLKEYTTQKLRQEWAEHEETFQFETVDKDKICSNGSQQLSPAAEFNNEVAADIDVGVDVSADIKPEVVLTPAASEPVDEKATEAMVIATAAAVDLKDVVNSNAISIKNDDSKSVSASKTKKRRKKSQMKKKNSQRKTSSSSSVGSNIAADGNGSGDGISINACGVGGSAPVAAVGANSNNEPDTPSISLATNSSSNDDDLTPKSGEQPSAPLVSALAGDESPLSETYPTMPHTPTSASQRIHDLDIHFFSDTEVAVTTPSASVNGAGRPSTPIQSDSELETTMREKHREGAANEKGASWKWGELPTPEQAKPGATVIECQQAERQSMLSNMFSFMKRANKIRKEANEVGDIYLSDLDAGSMDPEMAALYFPSSLPKESQPAATLQSGDEDRESGNGTSLPHSPSSMEGQKSLDSDYDDGKQQDKYLDFVAMSLCGLPADRSDPSDEEFERHLITYPDVCKNPTLFSSPNLVVRLNGKFYTWTAACPIVMTIITFQKPLPNEAIEQLMSNKTISYDHVDAKDSASTQIATNSVSSRAETENTENAMVDATAADGQPRRFWWNWRRNPRMRLKSSVATTYICDIEETDIENQQAAVGTQTSRTNSPDVSEPTLSKTDSTVNAENTSAMVDNLEDLSLSSNKGDELKERFKKTLRLSSSSIKKLNLKEGMNQVDFSVTTAYQGTSRCTCFLFKWKHNDKVVISDIDGTITRSDVLGHILPMVGKDWAQFGVAQLFSKIEQNGYKLLYLSARAIGQSRLTREYLRSIRQSNVMLPEGPLLLNPTSLLSAFHREVIEKKPEQFKIACLSDIRDLFPNNDPFYAGYGNKINDVWAYRAVGIPIMRIFTINTKGELKHELTQTFQSSYCSMAYIVDQLFPPIQHDGTAAEYSNFNFWRDPLPDLDMEINELLTADNDTTVTLSTTTLATTAIATTAATAATGDDTTADNTAKHEVNAILTKTTLRPIPEK